MTQNTLSLATFYKGWDALPNNYSSQLLLHSHLSNLLYALHRICGQLECLPHIFSLPVSGGFIYGWM